MTSYRDRTIDVENREFFVQPDDELIICRCEEITKGEIRRAVFDGMQTITEVKRYSRAGMGLCQGQTCSQIIQRIIAAELGVSPTDAGTVASQIPVRPVEAKIFGQWADEHE
jgi:NAD(P)H-nitrite reductase large subunit